MEIGDKVEIKRAKKNGRKPEKEEILNNNQGIIIEKHRNFLVIQYEKGYKECFREEELRLC